MVLTSTQPQEFRAEGPAMTQHHSNDLFGLGSRNCSIWPKFFLKKVESGPVAPPTRAGVVTQRCGTPLYQTAMPVPPHRTQSTQVCALTRTKRWNSEPVGVQGTFLTPPSDCASDYSWVTLSLDILISPLLLTGFYVKNMMMALEQAVWRKNKWALPNTNTHHARILKTGNLPAEQ